MTKVSKIQNDHELGNYFKYRSETVLEADLLKIAIAKLHIQIKILETDIIIIKQSETFNTIKNIAYWNKYFSITKGKLKSQLVELMMEMKP